MPNLPSQHVAMRTATVAGQQGMWLTPGKRIALGATAALVGAALWNDPRGQVMAHVPLALMVLGVATIVSAWRAIRDERARRDQFAALDARWQELEAGMREAAVGGRSPVRFLQEAGFTRFDVRQAAMRRFRGDDGAASPRVREVAADGPSAAYLPKGVRPGPASDAKAFDWLPRP